jgi:large subunit ribosomal protein L2
MGKRIRVQRRGRGGQNFRASTHKRVAPAKYPFVKSPKEVYEMVVTGTINELVHDPGRGSPLSQITLENGLTYYSIVPEGVFSWSTNQFRRKRFR